jgi:putative aminopeptidase FrvX
MVMHSLCSVVSLGTHGELVAHCKDRAAAEAVGKAFDNYRCATTLLQVAQRINTRSKEKSLCALPMILP